MTSPRFRASVALDTGERPPSARACPRASAPTRRATPAGGSRPRCPACRGSARVEVCHKPIPLSTPRVAVVEGDAGQLTQYLMIGSVFFLYCPFSGARLERLLADLEPIARTRETRLCCLALPLPACSWLERIALPDTELAVYRSTCLEPTT